MSSFLHRILFAPPNPEYEAKRREHRAAIDATMAELERRGVRIRVTACQDDYAELRVDLRSEDGTWRTALVTDDDVNSIGAPES